MPGKIQDKENTIIKLAELLEVDIDVIKNKLSAEWVKDDSFVPIKTIPKVSELELMKLIRMKSCKIKGKSRGITINSRCYD